MLYKSVDLGRARKLIEATVNEEGEKINNFDLFYLPKPVFPTDFSTRNGLYLTDARWVAEKQARYLKRTCPTAIIVTMELHVPDEHFTKTKLLKFQFDDTFKEIVWNSRRYDRLSYELLLKMYKHGIVYAPCTTQGFKDFGKMRHWSEITEKHLLTREVRGDDGKSTTEWGWQYTWLEGSAHDLVFDCEIKGYMRLPFEDWRVIWAAGKDDPSIGQGILQVCKSSSRSFHIHCGT